MKPDNTASSTILAIDCSSGPCSVAIWKNNSITAYYEEQLSSLQAKKLIIMAEEALKKSDINYHDLTCVACTVGPGSFTGIRIGLASARGIAFASGIPVLGFNSLEVLAFGAKKTSPKLPLLARLNAGKGEIVYQYFNENMESTTNPELLKQELAPHSTSDILFPRADLLAELAATYPAHAVPPVPFYIRPPDAKLPGKPNAAQK